MNAFVQPIISIRASSLADLFDCPARWEAKNLLGKRLPARTNTRIGTAIHEAVTVYDFGYINEVAVEIDQCKEIVHQQIFKPNEEVDWSDMDQNTAEKIGMSLVDKYIQHIAPQQQFIGVEVLTKPLVLADLGLEITGTIDRIYQDADSNLGIGDIKTGKTAVSASGEVSTQNHAAQMGIYTVLAMHELQYPMKAPAQIYGLNTATTEKSQRVGIGFIENAIEVVLGNEETPGLLHHASKLIKNGIFYGNSKSMLCSEKYCPNFKNCKFK